MHKGGENFLNKKRQSDDPMDFPSSFPIINKKQSPTNELGDKSDQVNCEEIIAKINEEFLANYEGKGRLDECQITNNKSIFEIEDKIKNRQSNKPNFSSNQNHKNTNPHQKIHKTNYSSHINRNLPITKYREEILNKINQNQVIVIAGETGCGKTTQVPQFIYNDCKKREQEANILITQPRRIAAVSISRRLALEMNCKLGGVVGYHVGMRPVFNQAETKILIVTTGIFLQRIIHKKDLNEFTHIILDEVHERDIDIDFVLVLIKHILKDNPKIKLILMSATISTTLFANYFSRSSIQSMNNKDFYKENMAKKEKLQENDLFIKNNTEDNLEKKFINWTSTEYPINLKEIKAKPNDNCNNINNFFYNEKFNSNSIFEKNQSNYYNNTESLLPDASPIINIAEKIYPVRIFYLDAFRDRLGKEQNKDFSSYSLNFDKKFPRIDTYLYDICFYLIRNIHENNINKETNKRYTVLVFLPGFGEIATMHEHMLKHFSEKEGEEMEILRLHSNLSDDEQQKVFAFTPKRKIILSTNIAESSITISDIYYVIDFCLVKELKFNIKTNHETLDLNWASKASCNQRAGRAGRVGEGYVFRLVSQEFYTKSMNNFSSPEILRVPLEKLILKIKVWNCGEPEKILGRAIEPPKLNHIETAIINLQNYGALTLGTSNSVSGDLTELGKVYSEMPIDIKYSRLIMISHAFDMLEPAIITASILSQEKNIFRKDFNSSLMYTIKSHFASESESDVILYYNAYKKWEFYYGKNLRRTVFDRNIFRKNEISQDYELKWCKDNHLDPRVLREVLALNADIKKRLNSLHIYNEEDHEKDVDFTNDKNKTLFQLALAGAFYGKYIKCQFNDMEKIRKLRNNKSITYKIHQSINIRGIPDHIEDEVIHEYFKTYGHFDYFRRIGEDVLIQFDEMEYKSIIKKVLHIGSNFKMHHEDNEFSLTTLDSRGRKTSTKMKKPDYPFEVRLYDLFTTNQVEVEHTSINHVVIGENEQEISSMFYVAEDYYLKNGRFLSKFLTKMPNKPMLELILMLIFAPQANFYSNDEQTQYSSFRIVGSENDFRFTHLFSGTDIDQINSIRTFLNEIFSSKPKEKMEIESKRELAFKKLFSLINKRRIKIISNDEWWRLFYIHYPNKLKEKESNLKKATEIYEDINLIEYQEKFPKNNKSDTNNNSLNKRSNDILPILKKLNIREDYRLCTEEGIKLIEDERKLFNQMRNSIIKKISDTKKNIYLENTELVCGIDNCNSYICSAKNISEDKRLNLFKLSGWISGFVNILPVHDEPANNSDFGMSFSNEFDISSVINGWFSCKQNNHVLGIVIDNIFVVARYSSLKLHFPTDIYKKWEKKYWENDLMLIKEEEKELLKLRKEIIDKNLSCELCNNKFDDSEDYLKHVDKDPQHKRIFSELLEEVFVVNP